MKILFWVFGLLISVVGFVYVVVPTLLVMGMPSFLIFVVGAAVGCFVPHRLADSLEMLYLKIRSK